MWFFRSLYLFFQRVFGLSIEKRSQWSSTPEVFLPQAPKPLHAPEQIPTLPMRRRVRYQTKGELIILLCEDRRTYRRVTKGIDKLAQEDGRGVRHKRMTRDRVILLHESELSRLKRIFRRRDPLLKLRAS